MAPIPVRNFDDDVTAKLQARAWRYGRSSEVEVRHILKNALKAEVEPATRLGLGLHAGLSHLGLAEHFPELRAL